MSGQDQSNARTRLPGEAGEANRIPAPRVADPAAMQAAPHTGGHRPVSVDSVHTAAAPPIPQRPASPRIPVNVVNTVGPQAAEPAPPGHPQPVESPRQQQLRLPQYTQDPAMESLLARVMTTQRPSGQKFAMVVVPDDDWPRCHEYDTVDELIAAIKELLGTRCHIFPYMGQRFSITAGQYKFLHTGFGALPLFDIPTPTCGEAVDSGWVGEDELPGNSSEAVEAVTGTDAMLDDGDAEFPAFPPDNDSPVL